MGLKQNNFLINTAHIYQKIHVNRDGIKQLSYPDMANFTNKSRSHIY